MRSPFLVIIKSIGYNEDKKQDICLAQTVDKAYPYFKLY